MSRVPVNAIIGENVSRTCRCCQWRKYQDNPQILSLAKMSREHVYAVSGENEPMDAVRAQMSRKPVDVVSGEDVY